MRIISDFKDYYDSIQVFGDDKELVYVRKRQEFAKFEKVREKFGKSWRSGAPCFEGPQFCDYKQSIEFYGRANQYDFNIDNVSVYFCGKVYRLYVYAERAYTSPMKVFEAIEDGSLLVNLKKYDTSETELHFVRKKKAYQQIFTNIMNRMKKQSGPSYGNRCQPCNEKGWNAFIAENGSSGTNTSASVFRNFDAPIILVQNEYGYNHKPQVVVNPNLKDLDFATIIDPFAAYQEIDMFLGSTLARQNDPVPMRTQELIRDAHGFDGMSFKQYAPGDKKKRRAENKEKKRRIGDFK